jgi:hypothetical protein
MAPCRDAQSSGRGICMVVRGEGSEPPARRFKDAGVSVHWPLLLWRDLSRAIRVSNFEQSATANERMGVLVTLLSDRSLTNAKRNSHGFHFARR